MLLPPPAFLLPDSSELAGRFGVTSEESKSIPFRSLGGSPQVTGDASAPAELAAFLYPIPLASGSPLAV